MSQYTPLNISKISDLKNYGMKRLINFDFHEFSNAKKSFLKL